MLIIDTIQPDTYTDYIQLTGPGALEFQQTQNQHNPLFCLAKISIDTYHGLYFLQRQRIWKVLVLVVHKHANTVCFQRDSTFL